LIIPEAQFSVDTLPVPGLFTVLGNCSFAQHTIFTALWREADVFFLRSELRELAELEMGNRRLTWQASWKGSP